MVYEIYLGVCSGIAAAFGVYALIASIGVLPRWAYRTRTVKYMSVYELAAMFGCASGNLMYLVKPEIRAGEIAELFCGVFFGVFTGSLAIALDEVLNIFPVLEKKLRLSDGMSWIVLSMAAGKAAGAYVFFKYLV